MMRRLRFLAAAALAATFAAPAAQAYPGVATGDVNLRVQPTVNSPRITTIPAGAQVEVHGCPSWCQVTFNGRTGWASSNYIATAYADRRGPRYGRYREPMPLRAYWRYGQPWWDDRYGAWYDGRYWWRQGRWHSRPGITFQFGFGN